MMMAELCNDLTVSGALPKDGAVIQQVFYDSVGLPVTMPGSARMIAAAGKISDNLLLNLHGCPLSAVASPAVG